MFVTLLALNLWSCSEDPDDINKIEGNGSLTFTTTGAIEMDFEDDSLSASTHAGFLIIRAEDTEENNIWLLFETSKITSWVGDHTVARLGEAVQINFNLTDGSKSFSAETGTVTVTEYTESSIKGTFAFEAKNFSNESEIISGTNGAFTASLK